MIHFLYGLFFPLLVVFFITVIQVYFVGDYLLTEIFTIVPAPGQTREAWLSNEFILAVLWVQILALLFHVFWYGWGWKTTVDKFTKASMRTTWVVIFTAYSLIALGISYYWTLNLQEGTGLTIFLLFMGGFVSLYLTSASFSFVSIKYSPFGSMYLRHW